MQPISVCGQLGNSMVHGTISIAATATLALGLWLAIESKVNNSSSRLCAGLRILIAVGILMLVTHHVPRIRNFCMAHSVIHILMFVLFGIAGFSNKVLP